MTDSGTIRALLIDGNAGSAAVTQALLEDASAGLVELLHLDRLVPALEQLAAEGLDVILLQTRALGEDDMERIGRVLVQAPGVPIIVLAVVAESELALPMIRTGAHDFWVEGRDSGEVLLRSMRYAMERKPRLERLAYQANFDLLTGLPNRYLLDDRLAHAAARAKRQNCPLAVLFLDVDGFKEVNDRLGHRAGDEALRTIARRLTGIVRESDTVARIGGDEFAIVLESLCHVEDAGAVALKMLDALAVPFVQDNQRFDLTCSIGISFFLLDGTDARSLLDHADRAMYHAKQQGGNRYSQWSDDLGPPALQRYHLVTALQAALEHAEFRLFFQPQVNLESGTLRGVEALLRWQHPEQGLIGPASFIAVAEDSLLIDALDEWVLRTAGAQLRRWLDAGLGQVAGPSPFRMAVNLPARRFTSPGLSALVARVLAEVGLGPERLEVEFDETALVQDFAASAANVDELKRLGVRVALDDFGDGGASAISHLRRVPVDVIKLDRTLIMETDHPGVEQIVTLVLTELARTLAIEVVAEGVETPGQLAFLREAGCDAIQGYLLSPPLDVDAITSWLGQPPPPLPDTPAPATAKAAAARQRARSRSRPRPRAR